MGKLFLEQRKGHDLALDRLIREAKPEEIKLRGSVFCNREFNSELEYGSLEVLRGIWAAGLGKFAETVINEL